MNRTDALKKIVLAFAGIFSSVLASLFLLEIGLRVFHPQQESMRWFTSSARYGFTLKKNFTQDYAYTGHDFVMRVSTNSFGHRHREYDESDFQEKRVKKILLAGDSYVFGHGVNIGEHFATHLEALLEKTGNPFSLINSGVGGWGTLQQAAYLKDHLTVFNPDYIVLVFCGNDPDDDDKYRAGMKDNEKGLVYFPGKIFLRDHSHLYRFLFYRFSIYLHRLMLEKKRGQDNRATGNNRQGADTITKEQWARSVETIKTFHKAYLNINPNGILFLLSTRPWVDAHRRNLGAAADGNQLLYIDLYSDTVHLPDDKRRSEHDAHWSELLHRIYAQKLYREIMEMESP